MSDYCVQRCHAPVDMRLDLSGSYQQTKTAVLMAALATGTSCLKHLPDLADIRSLLNHLQVFGVSFDINEHTHRMSIQGCGGFWPNSDFSTHVTYESDLLHWLVAACTVGSGRYEIHCPDVNDVFIRPLTDAFRDLGAIIHVDPAAAGCSIHVGAAGPFGGSIRMNQSHARDALVPLLLVSPYARNDVFIELTGERLSNRRIEETLAAMETFGAALGVADHTRFVVPAPQQYRSCDYDLEPDWWSVCHFSAIPAVAGGCIRLAGLGPLTRQALADFVPVLEQVGCRVVVETGEIAVFEPAPQTRRRALDIKVPESAPPALVGVLGLLSARPSVLRGLNAHDATELAGLMTACGAEVLRASDKVIVRPAERIRGCRMDAADNPVEAMSLAVLGLVTDGIRIVNPTRSDPDTTSFLRELGAMTGTGHGG